MASKPEKAELASFAAGQIITRELTTKRQVVCLQTEHLITLNAEAFMIVLRLSNTLLYQKVSSSSTFASKGYHQRKDWKILIY